MTEPSLTPDRGPVPGWRFLGPGSTVWAVEKAMVTVSKGQTIHGRGVALAKGRAFTIGKRPPSGGWS